jgi:phosphohistidine phosphatase
MKTLSILRHAKSSWDNADIEDIDRPILPKGEKRTLRVCQFLNTNHLVPELIYSSPAKRALQTAQIIETETNLNANIQRVEAFYPGHIKAYLKQINSIAENYTHAMIIGHNPELSKLAADLLNENREWWIPTSGLVIVTFTNELWQEIRLGQGNLLHYIKPKTAFK